MAWDLAQELKHGMGHPLVGSKGQLGVRNGVRGEGGGAARRRPPACDVQAVPVRETRSNGVVGSRGACARHGLTETRVVQACRVLATVNCGTGSGGAPVTGVPAPRVRYRS